MSEEKQKVSVDFNEILSSATDRLKENLVETTIEELKKSLSWSLSGKTEEIVKEFIEKELQPELTTHLIDNKAAIVSELIKALGDVGESLGNKIREVAFENISKLSSYSIEEIMKRISSVAFSSNIGWTLNPYGENFPSSLSPLLFMSLFVGVPVMCGKKRQMRLGRKNSRKPEPG